ncbi:hypothetical protein GCG54_00012580, partial [Colletotrichum gloeosporioides]
VLPATDVKHRTGRWTLDAGAPAEFKPSIHAASYARCKWASLPASASSRETALGGHLEQDISEPGLVPSSCLELVCLCLACGRAEGAEVLTVPCLTSFRKHRRWNEDRAGPDAGLNPHSPRPFSHPFQVSTAGPSTQNRLAIASSFIPSVLPISQPQAEGPSTSAALPPKGEEAPIHPSIINS